MRTSLAISTALLTTAALLTSGVALAADPCPKDFRYERTGIFHKSPEKRLTGGKSVNGRVCLHFTRAFEHKDEWGAVRSQSCPAYYKHERVGVLHDSPKGRLTKVFRNAWKKWKGKRRACLVVLRPDAKSAGKTWDPPANAQHRRSFITVRWAGGDFVDYPGTQSTFAKNRSTSEFDCAAQCMNRARCMYATFDSRAKTCHLKAGAVVLKGIGSRVAIKKLRKTGASFKADGYAPAIFKKTSSRACPKGSPKTHISTRMQPKVSPNLRNCAATCASKHDCRYFIKKGTSCTFYRLKPPTEALNSKDSSCTHFKSTAAPLKPRAGGGGRA